MTRSTYGWLILGLVAVAAFLVGGVFLSPGRAAEVTHRVESKPNTVSNQGQKANTIDYADEEPVTPQTVTKVGDNLSVVSKTFKPPTDA